MKLQQETLHDDNGLSRSLRDDGVHEFSESSDSSSSCSRFTTRTSSGTQLGTKIITREEGHVRKARWAVAGAILLFSTTLSWAVYAFAQHKDYRSFTVEYELYAEEIRSLVQWEVQYNFALMQQLSASVTAAAHMMKSDFPNVTQPYFEISAGYVDGMGGIMAAAFAPLVESGDERTQWEEYSTQNQGWIANGEELRQAHPGHRDPMHGTNQDHEHDRRRRQQETAIAEKIFHWSDGSKVPSTSPSSLQVYAPLWQVSPPDGTSVNADLLSEQLFRDMYGTMVAANYTVLSTATMIGDTFDFLFGATEKENKRLPHAFIMEPVYSTFDEPNPKLVGMVIGVTTFGNLLDRLLPENGAQGIVCVISDVCGNTISYELNGPKSTFLGYNDLHDTQYESFRRSSTMESYKTIVDGLCHHELHVYPSSKFLAAYNTATPIMNASMVILAFLVTSLLLVVYDKMVNQRQATTLRSALRSGALLEAMFPANVRELVLDVARGPETTKARRDSDGRHLLPSTSGRFKERPIAEFYPSTTLLFADIAGFTSWASAREPFQVFQLLEGVFGAFDDIAKRRRVFKVETVGDCYVAVCGIPVARTDHAVVMSRFARDCMVQMSRQIKRLEVEFGPDTSSLQFRMGLHSGPVTGGVLRGDNARFQLFGDTMNTAARMESTGVPSRIQLSQATADLLVESCKSHWIVPREEIVSAKGKGEMQTYWLILKSEQTETKSTSEGTRSSSIGDETEGCDACDDSVPDQSCTACHDEENMLEAKAERLIDWNTDVLLRLLSKVVASRGASEHALLSGEKAAWNLSVATEECFLDEVADFVVLPEGRQQARGDSCDAFVPNTVKSQLRDYVRSIESLYHKNPFHNFEHASHVAMSVGKLLARIVEPAIPMECNDSRDDFTFGITSDPLTQFACVFSALIHDVDHSGLSNAQLVQEKALVALKYNNQSAAEQNSLSIAFDLLQEARFAALRETLCATVPERERFRQLVVNAVMATDIMAPDLKQRRNERWVKVFSDTTADTCPSRVASTRRLLPLPLVETPTPSLGLHELKHRKATIVIEHMLQASDVSHTMQHWHIYRQWNERLFQEHCLAYNRLGRPCGESSENRHGPHPAELWYQGELNFFDYYIIPLSKKLAQCGVFGVCCDEYLNYALQNRDEWQARGVEIVAEMQARQQQQEQQEQSSL